MAGYKYIHGKFYLGNGKYKSRINKIITKEYKIWQSMIRRCYDNKYPVNTIKNPIICEEWYNFQVFAEWCEKNYIEGFQLDKDILIKNNLIYSPNSCCFVPQEINLFFSRNLKNRGNYPIGVSFCNTYKSYVSSILIGGKQHKKYFPNIDLAFEYYRENKKQNAKLLAEKWKNNISIEVYNSLINFNVEITD